MNVKKTNLSNKKQRMNEHKKLRVKGSEKKEYKK